MYTERPLLAASGVRLNERRVVGSRCHPVARQIVQHQLGEPVIEQRLGISDIDERFGVIQNAAA